MDEVLAHLRVNNISDHLEAGTLSTLLAAGDFIYVQGAFTFSRLSKEASLLGSAPTRGVRRANGVEVAFTFDRYEATSVSAWSVWLSGHHTAGALVHVRSVSRNGSKIKIEGTVFGICAALEGLKHRLYEQSLLKSGIPYRDFEEEVD